MASRRKQPEAIALLSMYNDDDEEEEDLNEGWPEATDRMELDSANDEVADDVRKGNSDASKHRTSVQVLSELSQGVVINRAVEEPENIDPLDSFLPPKPKEKCPEELQKKFVGLEKDGGRYNLEIRNDKEFRNPDLLLTYQDIDHIGSCFSKHVFDPHGYDKSDCFDEIELDMRRM